MNENEMFKEWKGFAEDRAKNLVPDALVDDATQEAYIGLLKAIRTFNPDSGFQFNTYATHCIRNAVYDFMRKENRQTEHMVYTDKMEEILPSADATAHAELERYQLNEAIRNACGSLDTREEQVLTHRMLAEKPLSLQELANRFNTTKMSIKRDEDRLKKKIKENFNHAEWNEC